MWCTREFLLCLSIIMPTSRVNHLIRNSTEYELSVLIFNNYPNIIFPMVNAIKCVRREY